MKSSEEMMQPQVAGFATAAMKRTAMKASNTADRTFEGDENAADVAKEVPGEKCGIESKMHQEEKNGRINP